MDKLDKSGTLPEVAAKLRDRRATTGTCSCAPATSAARPRSGQAAWDALKKELKDRGLSLSTGPNACYRTKVGCLRICQGGPIAVVYPEGTWYAGMTADRIPLFVQQHLVEGRPIEEWVFAENPLPNLAGEPATGSESD